MPSLQSPPALQFTTEILLRGITFLGQLPTRIYNSEPAPFLSATRCSAPSYNSSFAAMSPKLRCFSVLPVLNLTVKFTSPLKMRYLLPGFFGLSEESTSFTQAPSADASPTLSAAGVLCSTLLQ